MAGAVIFALATTGGHILMEKRPLRDSYFPGQWVIPGGKPKPGEGTTETLVREMREELGCTPLVTIDLTYKIDQRLYYVHEGDPDFLVVPYLVVSWSGVIPPKVLDTGHELGWFTYSEVEASKAGFTRIVGQTIREMSISEWRA